MIRLIQTTVHILITKEHANILKNKKNTPSESLISLLTAHQHERLEMIVLNHGCVPIIKCK